MGMRTINTWTELANALVVGFESWTDKELNELYSRLSKGMDMVYYDDKISEEHKALTEKAYWTVTAETDNRYRKEQEPKIRKFFMENFNGKSWNDIKADEELYDNWGWYSDWHKDVFGYRPHDVVCGVYVSPY